MNWLGGHVQSLGDFVFFRLILDYLREEIEEFGIEMLGRVMEWVGGLALTLMIMWIMFQGFRIVTGRSRESMMALVMESLRATLILTAATSMAMFGTDLNEFLVEDVRDTIHLQVTGVSGSPAEAIDRNLAWMQVALTSIDALDVAGDEVVNDAKTRAMWFTGIGTAGPALVGGTMLLLYEVALALFVGLAPLFILSLLFEQTKSLFSRWLYYGIGTMFSMAVLSAMVSIALEMVARVSASFWASALAGSLRGMNFTEGISSQSMQQGGMGLILTVLIVSTPPMAAMFFQGTLGQFTAHSQVTGSHGASQPNAGMASPASQSYMGAGQRAAAPQAVAPERLAYAAGYAPALPTVAAPAGTRGAAGRSGG
jgi:type IV secretion system protein VirB6